jgi:hypothetical protein
VTYWLSKVRASLDVVKRVDVTSSLTKEQSDTHTQKLASFDEAQESN